MIISQKCVNIDNHLTRTSKKWQTRFKYMVIALQKRRSHLYPKQCFNVLTEIVEADLATNRPKHCAECLANSQSIKGAPYSLRPQTKSTNDVKATRDSFENIHHFCRRSPGAPPAHRFRASHLILSSCKPCSITTSPPSICSNNTGTSSHTLSMPSSPASLSTTCQDNHADVGRGAN